MWALPAASVFIEAIDHVKGLVAAADGAIITLDCTAHDPVDRGALLDVFNAARSAEWVEFRSECGKYLAEIAHEHSIGKYTLAELDEEEQSLDRLRRWSRELRARDIFGVDDADHELGQCADALAEYAEHVYRVAHSSLAEHATVGLDPQAEAD